LKEKTLGRLVHRRLHALSLSFLENFSFRQLSSSRKFKTALFVKQRNVYGFLPYSFSVPVLLPIPGPTPLLREISPPPLSVISLLLVQFSSPSFFHFLPRHLVALDLRNLFHTASKVSQLSSLSSCIHVAGSSILFLFQSSIFTFLLLY
jgi:hypothetical protein